MAQLKYEPLTEPVLSCEKVFQALNIFSKQQLQKHYDRSSGRHGIIGHVISLDEEQIILLINDEPKDKPTVTQHLLEDLQYELGKLVQQEATLDLLNRQERMINKYYRIIHAIRDLPEEMDINDDRDLVAEKLSC